MTELVQILEKSFSHYPGDQRSAYMLLEEAAEKNFPEYIRQLAEVCSSLDHWTHIRAAAGLQLKNLLVSREQSGLDRNKTRWLSLPLEIRLHVKECILKALGTESRPSTAAQCIAAIACVEFPINQWPDLIERLSQNLADIGASACLKEASLEALGYMATDMPEKQNVAPILSAIVQSLRQAERSPYMHVHVQLAATKALSEIVDWVVTRTLEEYVDDIVDVVCANLQTAEMNLYEEAAKCLYRIASRKFANTRETPIVVSLFRDEPMRQILAAASLAAADSSSSQEHYKYLKALCDLLCALGIHLADVWHVVMKTPPNFALYLSALTAFFMHPSIYLRAETANVIATFCGHERISKNEHFIACIPNLIQYLPKTMNKSCSPMIGQDLTAQYSRMDYENEVELQREYIRLRDHCLRMIRECATDHFDKLMAVVQDQVMNRCVAAPRDVNTDEWDVIKRLVTAVLQASYQQELATNEIRQQYLTLFDATLQCSTSILNASAPTLLNGILSILSAFYTVFDDFPERIPLVLNHLKAILLIENLNNQDIEITTTKRHSIALLLKIVSQYREAAKPYARPIFDLVAEVSHRVSMMQRANLVHVLAALSNLASNEEEQRDFLQNAIQYDIQLIQSEQFSASPADFLAQSGLTSAPDPAATVANVNCPYYQGRLNLKASLTALEGVLAQVVFIWESNPKSETVDWSTKPMSQYRVNKIFALFAPIVPKFFQFCKTLNSIYTPECMSLIHPAYGFSVLEMAPSERQTIVSSIAMIDTADTNNEGGGNGNKKGGDEEAGANGVGTDAGIFMRKFISEISDLIQSIIGLICARFRHDFYTLPNAQELITGTLCAIESVPNFRLRFWVRRTWSRMVTSCPFFPADLPSTIQPFVIALTNHLQKRLVEQWAIVKERQSTDEDAEPTEEELIAESTMSLLSRECASFIVNFILGESFSMKIVRFNKDSTLPINATAKPLMENRDVFLGVIGLLAKLITCPDSQAAVKCLPAMNVIVYKYKQVIDEQTAVHLLVHGIQSLQMYSKDDLVAGPILTLIFNIYAQLRPKYASLLAVLQQVPTCLLENLESFDQRIMGMNEAEEGKMHDKIKRDLMRKVLTQTKSRAHYRKASSEANGIEEDREMECVNDGIRKM